MKKMLFVIPWSEFYIGNKDRDFSGDSERAPEREVGLATYIASNGFGARIADMLRILCARNGDVSLALEDLWAICQEFVPDVIGFSFPVARFEYAAQIFDYLDRKYNAVPHMSRPLMIGGGVHPTLLPEVTLQHIAFDAVVVGEGEYPLTELLQGKPMQEIKGFYVKGMSQKPERADVVENIDEVPFPDWNFIDKSFYTQPSCLISNTRPQRAMAISFSRSCLYRCNFCAHSAFFRPRCHSASYFVEKIKHVASQCDVNTFYMLDSSIGNFKKEWSEVCSKFIEMGSPYKWWAYLRANQVDRDFLILLKKAGCVKLFFGFESGSERVLKRMNKRITVEQCRNAAALCHELQIPFYSSYVVNYFGETEEDLQLTEDLILQTRPASLAVNQFSVFPGSKDFDENKALIEPYIKTIHDWTKLGMRISPLLFGDMSEDRFNYWYKRLRSLRARINENENEWE